MNLKLDLVVQDIKENSMKKKCDRCKKNDAEKLHTCPYQTEINDNFKFKCNCCEDCKAECCMEI